MNLETLAASSESEVEKLLRQWNKAYRIGDPMVPDEMYDAGVAMLVQLNPANVYLQTVEEEPEAVFGTLIRHSTPMRSTDKAYTDEAVAAWVSRIQEAAGSLPASVIMVRITPKLDGLAARFDGKVLATRGKGGFGQDITRAIKRGLVIDTDYEGVGELVVDQPYFEAYLKEQFDLKFARNFMTGLMRADTLEPHHTAALTAKACRFVAYDTLPDRLIPLNELVARYRAAATEVQTEVPYATDGAVMEVVDQDIREVMGSATTHHRWMVAVKEATATADARCKAVIRTGRCVPVALLEGVELSGALIQRATCHHARKMLDEGIGQGALLTIMRRGLVIPYIADCKEKSSTPVDISTCPSCGGPLVWDESTVSEGESLPVHLICPNREGCPAQTETALMHFFERMGINGFGPKICEQLAAAGVRDGLIACGWSKEQLVAAGNFAGVAENLLTAIETRKTQIIQDFEAVAAIGVRHLGRGDARKILEVHPWQDFGKLTESSLLAIKGFGKVTAPLIAPKLAMVHERVQRAAQMGFRIEATVRAADVGENPVKGKKVVFTGTMPLNRDAMEQMARELGATVQGSVSKLTDLLIFGEGAGSKLAKAESLKVQTMPVAAYMDLIGSATEKLA
mgnify:CR=1 FL=1